MSEDKQMENDELVALIEILKNTNIKPITKISYGSFGEIFKAQDSEREYALKVTSK